MVSVGERIEFCAVFNESAQLIAIHMNKSISLLIFLFVLLFMSPSLPAQNPFKKLGNKVKDKIGLKKKEETASDSANDESDISVSASEEAGATESSPSAYPDPDPRPTENQPDLSSIPGFGGGSSDSGPDESLFPDTPFSQLPITDKGVSGKGIFLTKSGKIVYEKESENPQYHSVVYDTLFFDAYGMKQARHTRQIQEVNMMGIRNRQESYSIGIIIDTLLYSYDPQKRTGVIMANPASDIMNLTEDQQQEMGKEMGEEFDLQREVLGTDVIAGKRCEVSDNTATVNGMTTKSRIWRYKNLVLKMISSGMGVNLTEEALQMEENLQLPASRFEVPADVRMQRMDYGRP